MASVYKKMLKRKGVLFSIRIYDQFAFDALSQNVYFFRHVVMKHQRMEIFG